MRKYLFHFGFLSQDILLAKYLNNSLIYSLIFIKWRYVPLLGLAIVALITTRLQFGYNVLDLMPIAVIIISWCVLVSLQSFRPEKIHLRAIILLVIITVCLDLLQVNLFLSSLLDLRYSGFWDNGRIAGMSREPSYYADYVFLGYISLFVMKRFVLGLCYLLLLYLITQANSLILYFAVFHMLYSLMRLFRPKMRLRVIVFLVLLPTLTSYIISVSGFAEWTFEAHGSWRTISNDLALKHALLTPRQMSDFYIYGIEAYRIDWLSSIFGYFYIIIYSMGWCGGILAYWFTCFLFGRLVRNFTVDNRTWRASYASYLIFVLFAPKWHFILLLTPVILKGCALNFANGAKKSE